MMAGSRENKGLVWLIAIGLMIGGVIGGFVVGYNVKDNSANTTYIDKWHNDTVYVDKWHNDTVYVDVWHNDTIYVDYTPKPPINLNGLGDTVSNAINLTEGSVRFNFTHSAGSSNFIIWLYSSSGEREELLVNEIGTYSGSKLIGVGYGYSYDVEPGRFYLEITADGTWTVEITHL